MSKYYYHNDPLFQQECFTIEYWKEFMQDNNLKNFTVLEAKMVKNSNEFYCSELMAVGLTKESCGAECDTYSPRNGVCGRCRYHRNTYEPTDVEKKIKQG
jgi:hypothetical protein